MKLFGKEISKKEKGALIAQLVTVVLSGIFAIILTVGSFAWFSFNSSIEQSGMNVVVNSDSVDLLVEHDTAEYESGYDGVDELKATLTADGYSMSALDSAVNSLIVRENVLEEATYEGQYFMMPGAYGHFTFYVRPKAGHDGERVSLALGLDGYANVYEEGEEDPTILPVTKTNVMNVLKGHVLLFTGRTGADHASFVYSGQITNGALMYDMSQHSKCAEAGKTDRYEITLYWEWPCYYTDIAEHISTLSPAETKRYPPETGTYLTEHPEYFYPGTVTPTTDVECSDFYNDGDQLIGDNVDFLVVRVSAF